MKKISLFLSAVMLLTAFLNSGFMLSSVAHAAGPDDPIEFPDENFKTALIDAGVDTSHDGNISYAEMAVPTTLDICGINITDITGIEYATSLTWLKVEGTSITSLPAGFAGLTSLETLRLPSNDFSSFPEAILDLHALTELELDNNGSASIASLPSGIGGLVNLEKLNLFSIGLTSLPSTIGSLINLRELHLQKNALTSLPENIGSLVNLNELDVWENRLASIPESMSNLTGLTDLDLKTNRLTELPEGIFDGMTNLDELTLDENYLDPLEGSPDRAEIDVAISFGALVQYANQYSYEVVLDYNGGSGDDPAKPSYFYDESFTFPVAAREGYTFTGWDLDGDGEPDKQAVESVNVRGDPITASSVTYQADYGFTVTFALQPHGTIDGGTEPMPIIVNPGEPVSSEISSVPVAAADPGYTFLGWFEGDDPNPMTEEEILGESIEHRTTFTAEFEAIGTIHFSDKAFKAALIAAGADTNGDGFITGLEMAALTQLSLTTGGFTDITGIESATELTSLALGPGIVSTLPAELATLSHLTALDVSGNRVAAFPAVLQSMAGLETLDISDNLLTGLPEGCFGGMTALTALDLSLNYFNPDAMPADIPAFAVADPQKTYHVTLDFNRGSGDALPKSDYHWGEPIALPDATRYDYDFLGWEIGSDVTEGEGYISITPAPPDKISSKIFTASYECQSARLTDIGLSAGASISPEFDLDQFEYDVYLPYSVPSATVSPTAAAGSSFTINGEAVAEKTFPLALGGKATVHIECAQPGKFDVTYTLVIYRIAPVLQIGTSTGALSPVFGVNTFSYSVSVPVAVSSVTITPQASDSCAGMTINGDAADQAVLELSVGGSAEAEIDATAANGAHFIYHVTVTRAGLITGILTSSGTLTPAFDGTVEDYTVDVGANVSSVRITPVQARTGLRYLYIDGHKWKYTNARPKVGGSQTVVIKAVATDRKTVSVYRVTVRRASLIDDINLSAGTLDFNPATSSYTVDIPADLDHVTLSAVPAENDVKAVAIDGSVVNEKEFTLPKPGSSVKATITAVATDGKSKSAYCVTIRRAPVLSGIFVQGGKLSPSFNATYTSDVKTYAVSIPATSETVTLTPEIATDCTELKINETSVDSITLTPKIGETIPVTISGKTAAGTAAEYAVNVSRAALVTNIYSGTRGYSIDFDPTQTDYTVNLSPATSSFTIKVSKARSGVKYLKINGRSTASYTVKPPIGGLATVTIEATASDRTTKIVYTVTVKRNELIRNIEVSEGALAFDAAVTKYTVDVPADTDTVTVTPEKVPDQVKSMTINGGLQDSVPLAPPPCGSATAKIVATATDGRSAITYYVTARRAAIVSGIEAEGGTLYPAFDPARTSYTLTLPATATAVTLSAAKGAECSALTVGGIERDSAVLPAPSLGGSDTVDVYGETAAGTHITYTIIIKRTAPVTNIYSGTRGYSLTPAFDPAQIEYYISLKPTASSFTVKVLKARSGVKYLKINGRSTTYCTVKPPIGGSATVTIQATDTYGTVTTYTVTVERQRLIDGIAVTGAGSPALSPAFDATVTSYTVELPADVETATVAPDYEPANVKSVSIDGSVVPSKDLSPGVCGSATARIVATATDGRTKATYFVTARRAAIVSALEAEGGTLYPAFDPARTSYTLTVPATAASVTLSAAKGADCSLLTIGGEERDSAVLDALPPGGSGTPVEVYGETVAGTHVTYTVTVKRPVPVTNIYSGTRGYGLNEPFDPAQTDYRVSLKPTASSFTVKVSKARTGVKYLKINGRSRTYYTVKPPIGGSATVTVQATGTDGTVTTYTVTVERQRLIDGITVEGEGSPALSPAFDAAVASYTVDVPYETDSVTITPEKTEGNVKYLTIDGSSAASRELSPPVGGSVRAKIIATAMDGRTKATYYVTVRRAAAADGIAASGAVNGSLATAPDFSGGTLAYDVWSHTGTAESVTVRVAYGKYVGVTMNGLTVNSLTVLPCGSAAKTVEVVCKPACGLPEVTYVVTVHWDSLLES